MHAQCAHSAKIPPKHVSKPRLKRSYRLRNAFHEEFSYTFEKNSSQWTPPPLERRNLAPLVNGPLPPFEKINMARAIDMRGGMGYLPYLLCSTTALGCQPQVLTHASTRVPARVSTQVSTLVPVGRTPFIPTISEAVESSYPSDW